MRKLAVPVALAACLAASPASAQETEGNHLRLHGYLTQALARAYDTPYLGITEEGTADYRKAALQLRYDVGARHSFLFQLSHERFGESPLQATKEDVEFDWAFYQLNLPRGFWARAGRTVIPMGVYNEIRDVGTILPFYRLPYSVYGEGTFSTETLSGVAAGRRWGSGRWGFDLSAYYGETGQLQEDNETEVRLRNFTGGQGWLETPLERLRLGVGYWRADARGSLSGRGPEGEESWDQLVLSVDGEYRRLRLVGEWTRLGYESGPYTGYYLQGTGKITDRLSAHVMYENADYEWRDLNDPEAEAWRWDGYDEEWRLGLSFALRPDVVLRLEHHVYRGYTVEPPEGYDDSGPRYDGDHTILSLSASF